MTEPEDHDDVDVFISPRRFGGRTPGPQATMQKVFEEEQAKSESQSAARDEDFFEGVKYKYNDKRSVSEDVHKSIGKNNLFAKVLTIANYSMVFLGLALLGVSIWVLLKQKNGGVFSFLSKQGIFLRAPLAIGLCFLVVAGGCMIAGYFVGVRHIAPSAIEGLQLDHRRKVFYLYLATCYFMVFMLGLIFFCSLPNLNFTTRIGIMTTTWQDMSISHPDRICSYEIKNGCAGAKDFTCSLTTRASVSKSCPGHYCIGSCKATSPHPAKDKPLCEACFTSFQSAQELSDCRKNEARKSSSRACLPTLRKEVQHFLTVVVVSSGTGMGLLLIVTILSSVCPILESRA